MTAGYFGKLPCRGDFLRAGLPSAFVTAWDGWVSAGLTSSRAAMGDDWMAAWMEAPVWRFLLPAGQCGPDPVLGLWMPSVDNAGRCFPLMLAAVFTAAPPVRDDAWLDAAEACGRIALEHDGPPAELAAALAALPCPVGAPAGPGVAWWTEGAPRVPPTTHLEDAMPAPDRFAAMLALPAGAA